MKEQGSAMKGRSEEQVSLREQITPGTLSHVFTSASLLIRPTVRCSPRRKQDGKRKKGTLHLRKTKMILIYTSCS